LKVTYYHLSEAEQAWNYTHQQLDASCVEVDRRTHMIIHLKHANEQQDFEQQVQVLQFQVPPMPAGLTEPDAVSDVDEE
jgi:3-deoxy-D-arabino-heptulosonate 7-phosphate (DAHP) synthase